MFVLGAGCSVGVYHRGGRFWAGLGRGGDVGKGAEGQTEPPDGKRKPLTLVRCP